MAVPDEVQRRLEDEPLTAFLATAAHDRPHVAPVWYRYEDGVVEITTIGRKLANLRRNPRAALAIQKAERGLPEWMVILFGTATIIEDPTETERVSRQIDRKYGVEPGTWPNNTLVRIEIGSVTYRTY